MTAYILFFLLLVFGALTYDDLARRLQRIARKQHVILHREKMLMSIAQEILDAVQASRESQDTLSNAVTQLSATVDGIVTAVDTLLGTGAITAEQAAAIIGTARDDKAAADAATATAAAANQRLTDEIAKVTTATP